MVEMIKIVETEKIYFPGFRVEPNQVNSKYSELNHYTSGTECDNYCIGAPRVFKKRLATRATQAKSAPRDSRDSDSRLVQPWRALRCRTTACHGFTRMRVAVDSESSMGRKFIALRQTDLEHRFDRTNVSAVAALRLKAQLADLLSGCQCRALYGLSLQVGMRQPAAGGTASAH